MVIITPLLALQALQIGAKVAEEVTEDPKVKNKLRIFNQIAAVGTSMAGAFKSPSTGDGLKIGKGITSEAGSLKDMFKSPYSSGGLANSLLIGEPTQPGLFKPLEPLGGIGAGWGM